MNKYTTMLNERAAELAEELRKIDSGERPLSKQAKAGVKSNVFWKRRTCILIAELLEGKPMDSSMKETIEHYAIGVERSSLEFKVGQSVLEIMMANPTYNYERVVKAVAKHL